MRLKGLFHLRRENASGDRASFVPTRFPFFLYLILFCLYPFACGPQAGEPDRYAEVRQGMVRVIKEMVRETRHELGKRALDRRVIAAMSRVPRHEFVPSWRRGFAYENRPVPIGHGQTISQPYIVAIMTDLLELKASDRVLEVGTGSGYQAAILAELVKEVYTIEIIEPLAREAKSRLAKTGYGTVATRVGDGYYGWEEAAPFDAIIVTAAASHIPPPLIRQLKPGGRMMIPVGSRFLTQQLILVKKDAKGKITTRQILPVRFVPLTGGK